MLIKTIYTKQTQVTQGEFCAMLANTKQLFVQCVHTGYLLEIFLHGSNELFLFLHLVVPQSDTLYEVVVRLFSLIQ